MLSTYINITQKVQDFNLFPYHALSLYVVGRHTTKSLGFYLILVLELSPHIAVYLDKLARQYITLCIHMCVWVGSVQAEQPELSRNSWSSKISLEFANDCKIYSTQHTRKCARAAQENKNHTVCPEYALSWLLQCLRRSKFGYVTWAGVRCHSWWSLQQSVPPASACTSWPDHGSLHSEPMPHRMAGAIKAITVNN